MGPISSTDECRFCIETEQVYRTPRIRQYIDGLARRRLEGEIYLVIEELGAWAIEFEELGEAEARAETEIALAKCFMEIHEWGKATCLLDQALNTFHQHPEPHHLAIAECYQGKAYAGFQIKPPTRSVDGSLSYEEAHPILSQRVAAERGKIGAPREGSLQRRLMDLLDAAFDAEFAEGATPDELQRIVDQHRHSLIATATTLDLEAAHEKRMQVVVHLSKLMETSCWLFEKAYRQVQPWLEQNSEQIRLASIRRSEAMKGMN